MMYSKTKNTGGSKLKITAIYDNRGKSLDRYTVITDKRPQQGLSMALTLSDNPTDYNGMSQWGGVVAGDHLGKRVRIEDLPERVQKHIAERVYGLVPVSLV